MSSSSRGAGVRRRRRFRGRSPWTSVRRHALQTSPSVGATARFAALAAARSFALAVRASANALDAARKILATEGPLGFYKGAGSHYLRLGPHMVLVFVILEQLRLFVP